MSDSQIEKLANKISDKIQNDDLSFDGRFEDIVTILEAANELKVLNVPTKRK